MIQFPAQNFSASNWIIFFCTSNYSKFAITNQLVFKTSCIFLGHILDQLGMKIQQKQRRLKIAGEPMLAFSTSCYIDFGTKPGLEPFCSKSGLQNCQKKIFFLVFPSILTNTLRQNPKITRLCRTILAQNPA